MVENPNPPAYERVSLNEDPETLADDEAAAAAPPKPISASLRALERLVFSVGGWRSNFRGFWCSFAYGVSVAFISGIFMSLPFIPAFVGTLLATLALVQISTAWVHIVMTPPNPAPFYRRLPPFKKTFEATAAPVLALWLAATIGGAAPRLISNLVHLPTWTVGDPNEVPIYGWGDSWKGLVVGVVTLAIWALAIIPAHVVLVRVQASLLPPDEDSIIPFDRSFGSSVEPAVVGGKGFVTMKDAWSTVSRASWIRIYVLHAKVFAATAAATLLMLVIIIPEVMLMSKKGEPQGV